MPSSAVDSEEIEILEEQEDNGPEMLGYRPLDDDAEGYQRLPDDDTRESLDEDDRRDAPGMNHDIPDADECIDIPDADECIVDTGAEKMSDPVVEAKMSQGSPYFLSDIVETIDKIKQVMAKVKISPPEWARVIPEDAWLPPQRPKD